MRKFILLITLAILLPRLILSPGAAAQSNDEPVVRAVLFFSPTCPHCHEVIDKLLVPMIDQYGDRLQILAVNVTEEQGQQLYQAAIEHYSIPPNRLGVPTLIVNDVVLVGSGEIPDQFPQMVEAGLNSGGIGWPGIPGLAEAMATEENSTEPAANSDTPAQPAAVENPAPAAATAASQAEPPPANLPTEPEPTVAPLTNAEPEPAPSLVDLSEESVPVETTEAAPPDPIGISLAGLVLGGMLAALAFTALIVMRSGANLLHAGELPSTPAKGWPIPLLSVLGFGVAAYLAYVEITQIEAVCGPVGHCNVVQASPYAQIMGIPVAVLGLLNYLVIFGLWFIYRYAKGTVADWSLLALLAIAAAGTLFSAYLTLLEIFVIQAVCAWCISSAIITTAIMLIVALSVRVTPARRVAPA